MSSSGFVLRASRLAVHRLQALGAGRFLPLERRLRHIAATLERWFAPGPASSPQPATHDLRAYKRHVLAKIEGCEPGTQPFRHMFIEGVFPSDLYEALRGLMLRCKYGGRLEERLQDNPDFVNLRFSLVDNEDPEVDCVREIFSDTRIRRALLRKFYLDPSKALANSLKIHEEFEFVHCGAGRFQSVHVDIPPKFLSFVFYIPEGPVTPTEEERNATVMYDSELKPCWRARYRPNSACVFVPHFYSYHGFATVSARDVLVMFLVNDENLLRWKSTRDRDVPPYTTLLDAMEARLERYPLIEYGTDPDRRSRERARCRVNAPKGRVMCDGDGRPLPIPAGAPPASGEETA